MLAFSIIVSTVQFVGNPIHCWCPAQFTTTHVNYVKSYCWTKNTYYVPMDTPISVEQSNRTSEELTYYQWVPFILLLEAFMFKFPNFVWRLFNGYSGINLDKIVRMAETTQIEDSKSRGTTIYNISLFMDRWLKSRQLSTKRVKSKGTWARVCFSLSDTFVGSSYLTTLFLAVKVMYAANVVGQFFMLNRFLSIDYDLYGLKIIKMLESSDTGWRESVRFPYITHCDFKVRQLQNIQSWTVQCVLPVNLFNEKIFNVIWFWLAAVAIATCVNLIRWLYLAIFKQTRLAYIVKYLKISREDIDKKRCYKFANNYLRDDGVFVIRLVSTHSTELVATDLVGTLWDLFTKEDETKTYNTQASDIEPLVDNKADKIRIEKQP